MKKLNFIPLFILLIFLGCNSEETEIDFSSPIEIEHLSNELISETDLKNLEHLGFADSYVKLINRKDKLVGTENRYLRINDELDIPHDSLAHYAKNKADKLPQNRVQFRTFNLVSSPRTINIVGLHIYNSVIRNALTEAINQYNNLNIGLNFSLSFSNATGLLELNQIYMNNDIRVYQSSGPGIGGGTAGFPYSNGDPYSQINIYTSTTNFGLAVTRHVILHEIGHTIGLRHTDYFNRSFSCTSGFLGNEGAGSDGAVHIPGTPEFQNIDMNSVMLSCPSTNSSGQFSSFDITALEFIY